MNPSLTNTERWADTKSFLFGFLVGALAWVGILTAVYGCKTQPPEDTNRHCVRYEYHPPTYINIGTGIMMPIGGGERCAEWQYVAKDGGPHR